MRYYHYLYYCIKMLLQKWHFAKKMSSWWSPALSADDIIQGMPIREMKRDFFELREATNYSTTCSGTVRVDFALALSVALKTS